MKKCLTCYEKHDNENSLCQKEKCDHWVNSQNGLNCSIICSKKKKLTFEEIGNMFGLTRMRICQIEKNALNKIRISLIRHSSLNNESS